MLWWKVCLGEKCSGEIFTLVKNALVKHMFWWEMLWWNTYFGEKCSGETYVLVRNALVKYIFWWKMLWWNVCFGEKCSVDIYVLVPWNAMNEHWLPQLSSWDELALDLLFQISNAIVQWCHCTGNVLWCNVLGRNVLWWNIFGCKYHLGIISHWIFSFKSLTLCNAPEIVTKTSWKKLTQLNGIINVSYFVGASSLWSRPLFELPVA